MSAHRVDSSTISNLRAPAPNLGAVSIDAAPKQSQTIPDEASGFLFIHVEEVLPWLTSRAQFV